MPSPDQSDVTRFESVDDGFADLEAGSDARRLQDTRGPRPSSEGLRQPSFASRRRA